MVKYQSNQPYYNLHFRELPEDTVDVFAFRGEEHISRLFKYSIDLISEDPEIDATVILNKKATFVLNRGDEDPIMINGVISHFEQRGRTPDYVFYHAELVPKMWRLGLTQDSRVFQKMDIKQIVTQVLKDANFSGEDYEFSLKESYPELEYVVQYNETDFDFINRRLEHFGIFYYFDHRGDNDVVVFTDSNDTLPAIEQADVLSYNPNKDPLSEQETICEWTCQEKVVTGLVRLKDYNYRTPSIDLTVESQIDSDAPGTYYEYGDHFKDSPEGDFLAKVRNEEIVSRSKIFRGISDCRLFRTGFKFQMGKHYRDDWNETDFVLTGFRSRGTQRGLFNLLPDAKEIIPTFENSFEAIPIDIPFRPPRITPIPRIPGIMTSKLETGSGDEYAFIDEEGRYKMKTFFDLSDKGNGEASRLVRLSQPYSGPGYGVHLPNHADAEMVWSCIDGNVDRPIGLGTVPNPSQASPVIQDNKTQNIIRTAAGNEIVMDDKTEEAQIKITTPDANQMLFDDKDDKIEVTTTEKHKITMDDKNKNITVQTTDGHMVIMDDKNTKITVQSKNGHRISINDTGGSENITLVDAEEANTFVIDITNNKLVIMTNDGDIDMHAPNGTIDIKATTFNLETSGDTIIKADANIETEAGGDYDLKAGGNLTEEATGDLKQTGTNVNSEAMMDHKINGTNVSSEASMEQKSSGMNVTVEGTANNQIKGGMITIQATGPNTIKGMPVMIN
jgi:type VI secretion system secreted protein VgrG